MRTPCRVVVPGRSRREFGGNLLRKIRHLPGQRLRERAQPFETRGLPRLLLPHCGDPFQPRRALTLPRLRHGQFAVAQLGEDLTVFLLHRARFLQRPRREQKDGVRDDVSAGDGAAHADWFELDGLETILPDFECLRSR